MINEARLQELLDEATIDCYGEEEEFAGLLLSLDEPITFPLMAELAGTKVEVLGLDEATSNPYRGIRARVRRNDKEYLASLADLEFDNPDETSAEWLALYTWVAERL
jgi:hypothetical protein